ncbi:hypothetical protein P9738_14905 [Bacillus siamensis]|uniref:hypothetical protein n=1 Tax=Bacillus siamensis TaxID=659243 RepID=UPI000362E438|nr:hypothetical protein [Bacillus siamensis]MED5049292.1 hypothetical protein [Bacillus siamensis]MED5097455.1 hypothetical protein [Bacillus siamensis]
MSTVADLVARLNACPPGRSHWSEFENICVEILSYLFVPPLREPYIQSRTYSGIDRRDAVFANREDQGDSTWAKIKRELNARMILFEFKNYDSSEIGKEEVLQTNNYLTAPMGKLAIICSTKLPNSAAHIKRNTIYSDVGTVMLFLTKDKLIEMLYIKERGENPADLIMDEIEMFYLQHE